MESYYDGDEYNFGRLEYLPASDQNDAVEVVNELSLLLTAGRLGSKSKTIISDALKTEANFSDGLRLAQKLIISTPEFHSTGVFDTSSNSRAEVEFPPSSNKRYKAVSFAIYFKFKLCFFRINSYTSAWNNRFYF